ncbi:MAG: ABC transporter permease [Actinomycetota bacterium]
MTTLTGTGSLIRFILRRDRIRIPVWIAAILALVLSTATSVTGLYNTREELSAAADIVGDNPAFVAMNGPAYAIETVGGRVAWEVGAFGLAVVALMSMFLVGRQTRAEEESGRSELVRAAVVGRHAATTAALVVVTGVNLLLGALVSLILVGLDLPEAGSIAFGASIAGIGLVFAAITAVGAQVTEHTRGVYGIVGAVIGVSYVVRAAGDVGNGTLTWLSPIGWAQATRSFGDERWWPLLLSVTIAVVLASVAFALTTRRDVGAGLVPPKPGPPTASRYLTSPLGLALRLQRGSLIGWSAALFLTGLAYGSIGQEVEKLVGDNEELSDLLAQAGGSFTDSFFATTLLMLALISSGFMIQSALRLRSEETAGRAEPVLATPVGRWRWAGAHLTVAMVGTVIVIASGGLGTGLAFGVSTGDLGQVTRMLGAALAHTPAVWVLGGFTVAIFGLVPRASAAGWAALAGCFVVGILGPLLDLPNSVSDASPFNHVPQVPAAAVTAGPLLALTLIAAALAVVGLSALRRRDLVTA